MPCVLVTGSGGGLGKFIVHELRESNIPVILACRNLPKHEIGIGLQGDLRDPSFARDIFKQRKIDYVIHCAATWNGFNNDFEIAYNNIVSILNILRYSDNIKKFVYISSSAVYEGLDSQTEDIITYHPSSAYSISKDTGEQLVVSKSKERSFLYTLWRPFYIVSPYEKYKIGSSHLLTNLYQSLVIDKKNLDQHFDDKQGIPFTWAGDMAKAIIQQVYDNRSDNECFNIGNMLSYTAHDAMLTFVSIAQEMGLISKKQLKNITEKCRKESKQSKTFQKMKQYLDIEIATPLDMCIRNFLDYKTGNKKL